MAANKETSVGIKLVADLRNYQKNLTTAQKDSRQFQRNVSKNMGDVKSSISQLARGDISALPGFFKAATTSAGGFSKGLHGIKAALIATGIGALLVGLGLAIASITQYFKGTEEGQIVFKKVMNNIKAYTEPVLSMFGSFGKALVHLFKGEFSQAWDTAKTAINDVGGAIKENKEQLGELNALEESNIKNRRKFLLENKQLEAEIADLREKAEIKDTYNASQRAAFIAQAMAKQKQLSANQLTMANDELKIEQIKASFGDNDIETNDRLADLESTKFDIMRAQSIALKKMGSQQQTITNELNKEVIARQKIAAVLASKADNAHLTTIETRKFDGQLNPNAPVVDTSQLEDMGRYIEANTERALEFQRALDLAISEENAANINHLSSSFASLGSSIGGTTGNFLQLAASMLQLFPQLISQVVAMTTAKQGEAMASGIASSQAVPFPFNIVAIAATVASIVSAFAQIPKFADGGLAFGPTLGLMGEYSGARNNPEVIAPLNKLKQMLPGNQGSGPTEIFGSTKIMDDHILISYQRAIARQRNRT